MALQQTIMMATMVAHSYFKAVFDRRPLHWGRHLFVSFLDKINTETHMYIIDGIFA